MKTRWAVTMAAAASVVTGVAGFETGLVILDAPPVTFFNYDPVTEVAEAAVVRSNFIGCDVTRVFARIQDGQSYTDYSRLMPGDTPDFRYSIANPRTGQTSWARIDGDKVTLRGEEVSGPEADTIVALRDRILDYCDAASQEQRPENFLAPSPADLRL